MKELMPEYIYGEEVDYKFGLLKDSDRHKLKQFHCGNMKLDKFIHEDIIPYCSVCKLHIAVCR